MRSTYVHLIFFLALTAILLSCTPSKDKKKFLLKIDQGLVEELEEESEAEERAERENAIGRVEFEVLRHMDPKTGQVPDNIRLKELKFARSLNRGSNFRSKANEQSWQSRGPYNVGGRTRAVAIDVSDITEKTFLAGGVSGGMWRTTNGGNTWGKVTPLNQLQSVTCISQDKRLGKQNNWYYGTGELTGNSASKNGSALYRGDGIFKSTDGGKTWGRLPSTFTNTPQTFDNPFDFVWNIATDPSNTAEDELYAATLGGIQRSTDGGTTWQRVLGSGTNANRYTDVAVTSTGLVYAALSDVSSVLSDGTPAPSQKGIYKSSNGIDWVNITASGWPSLHKRTVIGIAPSSENIIYTITDIAGGNFNDHVLYRYDGSSWTSLTTNLPYYDSQQSYNMVVKVKPDNPYVVFLGGTNLYRSTDGFSSPGNTTLIGGYNSGSGGEFIPNHHPDQHGIVFFKNPVRMLSSHDGGVSLTNNNLSSTVSWSSLNKGYLTSQFYTAAIHQNSKSDIIVGGLQDNGSFFTNYVQADSSWGKVGGGDGAFCAIANDFKHLYVATHETEIYRLDIEDNGNINTATRVDPDRGAVTLEDEYLFINPYVLDPNNTNIMYLAGGSKIWRNDNLLGIPKGNGSQTKTGWTAMGNTQTDSIVSALAVSSSPANILYYATTNGRVFRLDNANTSTLKAKEITGTYFPKNNNRPVGYVSSIAIDPFNADKVMLTFSNYNIQSIFYTEDGGNSWKHVSGNLEEVATGRGNGPSVHWGTILYLDTGPKYFVGTTTGLYTTDALTGNAEWVQEGPNTIGHVVVDMVVTRQLDGTVVAATHGNGVYSTRYDNPGIPERFELYTGRPNPVVSETLIKFSLDKPDQVELAVFDLNGKKVRTLYSGYHPASADSVTWNRRDVNNNEVAAGIYICRLKKGKESKSRRIMVVN